MPPLLLLLLVPLVFGQDLDATQACDPSMPPRILTNEQIEYFKAYGVLVVPDVLTSHEVNLARDGFHSRLNESGVDYFNLKQTAENLYSISNGIGGIIELFYDDWKFTVMQHPNVFGAISDLWAATYASGNTPDFEHPYGEFDPSQGYLYIDRAGFRLPDEIVQAFGTNSNGWPLQFGVHPHFDADPLNLWNAAARAESEGKGVPPRWRPLQAFVCLTDTLEPNLGGFEAFPSFHVHAAEYFRQKAFGNPMGEFFPLIYGSHDDIIQHIQHIPAKSGDLVIWDWRIPHKNAEHNIGKTPREVIYTGFLPDVEINRAYARDQLDALIHDEPPPDFWNTSPHIPTIKPKEETISALGMRLLAMVNCTQRAQMKNPV